MKRSILYRILLVPLISVLFLLVVSGAALWSLRLVKGNMDSMSGHDMAVLGLSKELRYPLAAQSNDLRGFLLTHTSSYTDEAAGRLPVFEQSLGQIRSLVNDPREQDLVSQLDKAYTTYKATSQAAIAALKAGDDARGQSLVMNDLRDQRKALETLSQKLEQVEATIAAEGSAHAASTQKVATYGLLAACIASVVVTWVLGALTARRISRPLRQLSIVAQSAATGDLTVSMPAVASGDEVAQVAAAFNSMVSALQGLIARVVQSSGFVTEAAHELNGNTDQVARAAQSVAQAMDQVARGATSQSNSAQEAADLGGELRGAVAQIAAGAHQQAADAARTVAVVDQNVVSIRQVADRASHVVESSQQALSSARDGSRVMERTLQSMERVRATVVESGARIRKLGEASTQIGEITSVITGIAEQTNLLALNAAIEAARAGENGRGFAVVADEVRKLAERASHSAGAISELIGHVLTGTQQAVAAMEAGVADVTQGAELAQQAGSALTEIVGLVEQTSRDVASISAATGEIAQASDHMLEAVNAVARTTRDNIAATEAMEKGAGGVIASVQEIAAVSEENAAAAEEVSASTEEMTASSEAIAAAAANLRQVAGELQMVVSRFKV